VPEPYVDARKLAALMGVSRSTIKRWVAAGMPSETWGLQRTRRFLPSQAIAWARARSVSPNTISPSPRGGGNAPGQRQPEE
jgi:hypothetical protein